MKRSLFAVFALLAGIFVIGCDNPAQIQVKLTSKTMTSFAFADPVATGKIDQSTHTVAVTVPNGTARAALAPRLTHNGVSVSPASGVARDFTSPVTYTVQAGDGTSQDYLVTVSELPPPGSDRAITSFGFASPYAVGSVDEANHTVSITVPYGTSVTTLTPVITHSGKSISPASGKRVGFASPVTYTVTSENGDTQEYKVTVTVATNSAKAITSFDFTSPTASGYVDRENHTVAVIVPAGTDLTALVPSIAHTGASISPASGTAVDFTAPVDYTVTAMNGSTQSYMVTVTAVPAAPVISPDAALTYKSSVLVTLSCSTPGVDMYYTTDGTEPNKYSAKYSAPFTVVNPLAKSSTITVKALAIKGTLSSAVSTAGYKIEANTAPIANAGTNIRVSPGTIFNLDGSLSGDPDGNVISYQWVLVNAPAGNTASLANTATSKASFAPTVPGAYTLSLLVSDGRLSSQDSVSVFVTSAYSLLNFTVVDAAYSPALDSVVMVGTKTSALKVYNASTGQISSVDLPYEPVVVAVSPDGLTAAVGYSGGNRTCSTDNYVSVVTLSPTPVVASSIKLDPALDASNDIGGIAITSDHIYTSPATTGWEYFRCINLSTTAQKLANTSPNSSGGYNTIYGGGALRLRPNSLSVYYGEGSTSPCLLERWDSSGDVMFFKSKVPHTSEYGSHGNFWFSENGDYLINESGCILTASSTVASDLQLAGWLGGTSTGTAIKACNVSTENGQIVTISKNGYDDKVARDNRLNLYDASTNIIKQTIELPTFLKDNVDYVGHGAFVFFNAAGTSLIAIEKADSTYGVTDTDAVVKY